MDAALEAQLGTSGLSASFVRGGRSERGELLGSDGLRGEFRSRGNVLATARAKPF